MKNKSLITELFNKSYKQEADISEEISKILKGTYPSDTIDKIKQKINEKIENFDNTITLLTDSLKDSQSGYDHEIWLKKKSNLILVKKSLQKRLDETIFKVKKKNSSKNLYSNDISQSQFSHNMSNLQEEKKVLKDITLMANEIETNTVMMSHELSEQWISLSGIKDKIHGIYGKLTTSDTYTRFMIRRGHSDTLLCLFLGVLTIIIIYSCYYYLRPKIKQQY